MVESLGNTFPQFSALKSSHVRLSDEDAVMKKINLLVSGGKDQLQVITDFDRTLTRHDSLSSFAILEQHPHFPKHVKDQTEALVKKYYPIEVDPNISIEDKIPHMVEWWKLSEVAFKGLVLDYASLEFAVKSSYAPFRNGCDAMFMKLNENNIPTLIFSAGVGDVINCVIKLHSFDYPNVHVVSNFFEYNGDIVVGYKGPVIHVYNKNEHAIEGTSYFKDIKNRKNVILMGDSLGDANMAEGVDESGVILKIGFLSSQHIDLSLPQYLKKFDIVLLDDETMDIPLLIIDSILNSTSS